MTSTCVQARTHTCIHLHWCIDRHTHTSTHNCMNSHSHARTHAHTHTHTHARTHTRTHARTPHTPLATSTISISLCWVEAPPVFCSARWKDFRPCFPVRRRAVSSHRGRSERERSHSLPNSSGVRILSSYSPWATTGMSTIWSDVSNLLTMLSHWAWVRLSYCDRVAAEEREIANVTGHEVLEWTHH